MINSSVSIIISTLFEMWFLLVVSLLSLSLDGCAESKSFIQSSFSCKNVRNRAERMVCSSEELRALDAKMTSKYRKAVDKVDSPEVLVEDQKYWIAEVRNACKTKSCLYSVYRSRVDELQGWADYGSDARDNDAWGHNLLRKTAKGRMKRNTEDDDSWNWGSLKEDENFVWQPKNPWRGRWVMKSKRLGLRNTLSIKSINDRIFGFRVYSLGEDGRGELMGEATIDGSYASYKDRSGGCELYFYAKSDEFSEKRTLEVEASDLCRNYGEGRFNFSGEYAYYR